MNKFTVLILFALLATLTGCITVSTPDTASLNATVQASVSTAIAPYEEKYDQLISDEELETSQAEQNQKIQQYIVDQITEAHSDGTTSSATDTTSQIIPTATSVGSTASTSTDNSTCIDAFTYVSDLTVPDGQIVTPNTVFTKS